MNRKATFKELEELFKGYALAVHNNDKILHSTKHNDRTAKIKWELNEITNKYDGQLYRGYVINATHTDGEPLKKDYKQVANAIKKATMEEIKEFGLVYETMWATNENGFNYRVNAYNCSDNSEKYCTEKQREILKFLLGEVIDTLNNCYNTITELHLLQVEYEKAEHKKQQKELTYDRKRSYYYKTNLDAYQEITKFYKSERKKANAEESKLEEKGQARAKAQAKAKEENAKAVEKITLKKTTKISF